MHPSERQHHKSFFPVDWLLSCWRLSSVVLACRRVCERQIDNTLLSDKIYAPIGKLKRRSLVWACWRVWRAPKHSNTKQRPTLIRLLYLSGWVSLCCVRVMVAFKPDNTREQHIFWFSFWRLLKPPNTPERKIRGASTPKQMDARTRIACVALSFWRIQTCRVQMF